MSATAAVTASDMSIAGESIHSAVSLPGKNALNAAPSAGNKPAVIFAAPREVTQPLVSAAAADASSFSSSDSQADSLVALVDAHGAPEQLDGDMHCLAGAVYFESKGESLSGQLAVARVIINRARSGRFASSLCGVVFQPGQFSFVRGRSIPAVNTASQDWQKAVAITQIALDNSWSNAAEGALFFHARRVSPGWRLTRVAAIDNHIFYR